MVTQPPAPFTNGRAPLEWFRSIKTGHYSDGTQWDTLVLPYPLDFHNRLVARAKRRTGRTLVITDGYGAYRPIHDQIRAKKLYGNGAATVGQSSHGLIWEAGYSFAFDYHNWHAVYSGFGGREAFFADVRAEGGLPNMISPARGYPDEPWHVGEEGFAPPGGEAVDFPTPKEDEEMKQAFVIVKDDRGNFAVVGTGGTYQPIPSEAVLRGVSKIISGFRVDTDAAVVVELSGEEWDAGTLDAFR